MAWRGTSNSNAVARTKVQFRTNREQGAERLGEYVRCPELDHQQLRVAPAVQRALDLLEWAHIKPAQVDFLAYQRTGPPGAKERRRAFLELRFERLPRGKLGPSPEALYDRGVVRCLKSCCVTTVSASNQRARHSGRPMWKGRQPFRPASQRRRPTIHSPTAAFQRAAQHMVS